MENNLRYQFKLFDGKGKRMFWEMGIYPELVNKVCPHCGAHPMLEVDIYHVLSPYETNYQCPLCGHSFKPEQVLGVSNDDLTIETFSFDGERYSALEEENLSSIAKGLKDAKDKKVRILVDEEPQTYTQGSCGSDFSIDDTKKDFKLTLFTQYGSFDIKISYNSDTLFTFENLLKKSFNERTPIEFYDSEQRTHVFRTADLIGFAIDNLSEE